MVNDGYDGELLVMMVKVNEGYLRLMMVTDSYDGNDGLR
jgi:hypothetical protein